MPDQSTLEKDNNSFFHSSFPGMAMGWLYQKTHLKWREPKFTRQARDSLAEASLPRWFRPSCVLVFAGLLMLNWLVATLDPQKNPPPLRFALPYAFIASILLVYVILPL